MTEELNSESVEMDVGELSAEELNRAMESMRQSENAKEGDDDKAVDNKIPVSEAEPKTEGARETSEGGSEDAAESPEKYKKIADNYQAALREERARRQEEARIRKELEEKISALQNSSKKEEEEEDLDDIERTKREVQKLKQQLEEHNHRVKSQQEYESFLKEYQKSAREFSAQTPDFEDAYRFLLERRAAEYRTLGYPDSKIDAYLAQEEMSVAQHALNTGKNPADLIYSLAKIRGYTGKTSQTTAVRPDDRLKTLEKGVQSSKSLNGAGESVRQFNSLEEVATVSDDPNEFLKAFDEYAKNSRGRRGIF